LQLGQQRHGIGRGAESICGQRGRLRELARVDASIGAARVGCVPVFRPKREDVVWVNIVMEHSLMRERERTAGAVIRGRVASETC
jgi:hypothetical protein